MQEYRKDEIDRLVRRYEGATSPSGQIEPLCELAKCLDEVVDLYRVDIDADIRAALTRIDNRQSTSGIFLLLFGGRGLVESIKFSRKGEY